MNYLREYVKNDINRFRVYTKKPAMTFPLSQEDIDGIAQGIDNQLSPENLCCDGELSRSAVNRKYTYLNRVFAELKAHAKGQGLGITVETWEIS